MNLIDTHAHLDQVSNIDGELARAADAGVTAVVAVGIDTISNTAHLALQKRIVRPRVCVALGIHPESLEVYDQATIDDGLRFIRDNMAQAVAVGEIGLDYWYKWARKDQQKKNQQRDVFARQLELAREANLPVIIHSRGAWADCLRLVHESGVRAAVFHWYSGPVDVLTEIIASGYYISATPSLAYSEQHREAIAHAPIEQTLIETDSPVSYYDDGGQNRFSATPADVRRTLRLYAQLKRIDEHAAAATVYRNAVEFFGIPA